MTSTCSGSWWSTETLTPVAGVSVAVAPSPAGVNVAGDPGSAITANFLHLCRFWFFSSFFLFFFPALFLFLICGANGLLVHYLHLGCCCCCCCCFFWKEIGAGWAELRVYGRVPYRICQWDEEVEGSRRRWNGRRWSSSWSNEMKLMGNNREGLQRNQSGTISSHTDSSRSLRHDGMHYLPWRPSLHGQAAN